MDPTVPAAEPLGPPAQALAVLIALAPRVGSALVVGVMGLLLSFGARRLVEAAVRRSGLDALLERAGVARFLYAAGVPQGAARVLGNVALGVGLLLTVAVLAEVVGLPGVAEGVAAIVEFIPDLVAAAALVLFGLLAADFLSRLVERVGRSRPDLAAPGLVAAAVYWSVLVVVITMALQQLGLQTELVATLIQVAAAASLFGIALGLALAGRPLLANLLARHYAERLFRRGDQVRVGEVDGVVERFDVVTVTLRTADGTRVVLPCAHLLDGPVRLTRP